eukprot:jgi/Antlo1/2383/2078
MKSQLPNLKPLLFSQVSVGLKNGTVFLGTLVGYDAFCNLSLDSASSDGKTHRGTVVIRGQMIDYINRC